jgi:hypothetical protein
VCEGVAGMVSAHATHSTLDNLANWSISPLTCPNRVIGAELSYGA